MRAPIGRPIARLVPLALFAIVALVFSPALDNGFVQWDDDINLYQNHGYRGLGWTQIRWMLTTTLTGHYIPVTWLSFGIDHALWGMNPRGYHLTSVLLHAANGALFYLVARRLLARATGVAGTPLMVGSAVAALVFGIHPLRVESVAWATERRDVLSGLFVLIAVLAYLRAADALGGDEVVRASRADARSRGASSTPWRSRSTAIVGATEPRPRTLATDATAPYRGERPATAQRRARRWLLTASVAAYALALLSKSIVMTLPLLLLVLDVYPLRRLTFRPGAWRQPGAGREPALRAVLLEKVPYAALAVATAAAAYWIVASKQYLTTIAQYGWPARIGMTAYSLWFYVEKTALPTELSALYELPAAVSLLEPRFLLSLVAVIAVTALLLALRHRWPAALAAWIAYAIALGPVTGIVHSGHQLTHDRYSYVSCMGWALLAGAAAGAIARGARLRGAGPWFTRAAAAVIALWIASLAVLAWQQIGAWRDTETLWRYAIEADPGCGFCQASLGDAFFERSLVAAAEERYRAALAVRPDSARAHIGLGFVLLRRGEFDEAMPHFRAAVAQRPGDPVVLTGAAVALLSQNRHPDAIPLLERAVRIDPGHFQGHATLGAALIDAGAPEQALAHLVRAIALRPDDPGPRAALARAYLALGRGDDARAAHDALARLAPDAARALAPDPAPRARILHEAGATGGADPADILGRR